MTVSSDFGFCGALAASNDYTVKMNGQTIPVYTCTVSKFPLNTVWPGHQRDIAQSEKASFINIVSDGDVCLEVTPKKVYKKVYLKPYSKNVTTRSENGIISFTLRQNGAYLLELDTYHGLLYIFNNKYFPCEAPDKVTYYFGKGVHDVGTLQLRSDDVVYVDKDAYCYGNLVAEGAQNIRIYGNGIFDQSKMERESADCLIDGNLKFVRCRNVTVQGVGFTNSRSWCVSFFNCFDMTFDGIHVFGQYKYNTDGIDIVNSQNVRIKNSFVHSFDDTIAIKAYDRSLHVYGVEADNTDCKHITIENCVLCCDWGRCMEFGYETACREYSDVTYRDCDIVHTAGVALSIHNGDYAEIHNVRFEDIRVEYNAFDTPEQYQHSDAEEYVKAAQTAFPLLMEVCNHRFRADYNTFGYDPEDIKDIKKPAYNHDITAERITVYYDEDLPFIDGRYNVRICAEQTVPDVTFDTIVVRDLRINGERITRETAVLTGNAVDAVTVQ